MGRYVFHLDAERVLPRRDVGDAETAVVEVVVPQRLALIRGSIWYGDARDALSIWSGEPVWLPKAKDRRVDIFFTLQGEYDD